MVIPYIASAHWYAVWLLMRVAGYDSDAAARQTDKTLRIDSRDLCRALIVKSDTERIMLSVPIEGGSSKVKRLPFDSLQISEHGNWEHTHIHTMRTILGRSPYSAHFLPVIEDIITNHPPLLSEMNLQLHEAVMKAIDLENLLPEAARLLADNRTRIRELAEGRETISADACILQLIVNHGRESIFPLLALAAEEERIKI